MEMRYRRRTIALILIWIVLALIMTMQTVYFGYERSVETSNRTVRAALLKVNENLKSLIDDEIFLLGYNHSMHINMGAVVPLLQEHGLEKDVPDQKHLKKYTELLDAEYIAVQDKQGKTITSYGRYYPDESLRIIRNQKDMFDWATSADSLVSEEKDHTTYQVELSGGNIMIFQIHNEELNRVQNEAFSWRAILNSLSLPGDAQLIVISKEDDTILVHPDDKVIGKSYTALGYKSENDFFNNYNDPDQDGIAYHKGFVWPLLNGEEDASNLSEFFMPRIGSGYIDCGNVYVLCLVNQETFFYHLIQERGLLIIYTLGSLLVLSYILFRFRYQRRIHKNAPENEDPDSDDEPDNTGIRSRLGFLYERDWSRRLGICCLVVLIVATFLSIHAELLSNSSQNRIQEEQGKKLTKTMKQENEVHRQMLDEWFNNTSTQMANVIAYAVTRDDRMQSREVLKEIAEAFQVQEVSIYSQDGKLKVTNSIFDHVDLYENPDSRMSKTFLPLLDGLEENASTPITRLSEDEDSDQKKTKAKTTTVDEVLGIMAFAGVSIRNAHDLCDGCLGITIEPVAELWGDKGTIFLAGDTYDTILKLTKVDSNQLEDVLPGVSQTRLIFSMLRLLLLCLILFWAIGTLKRVPKISLTDTTHEKEQDPEQSVAAEIKAEPEKEADKTVIADGSGEEENEADTPPVKHHSEKEQGDLFYSIFGKERDYYFNERWNYDSTPFFRRTPEKQLFFVMKCILVVLGLQIIWLYLTQAITLNTHSTIRNIINGGWKEGPNIYALTASEMVIIVIYVVCMALHRLVYYVARFSTPRVETVCHLVYSTISYAGVFVSLYYCLTFFGVHARTMLAGAGILGIVISFGAQSTIADILSGIFLIFEDVIHVGDYVKVGNTFGIIKNIGVRMTKVQSYGTTISINNSDLKAMENMSAADARVNCDLALATSEDLKRAEDVFERELPGITERIGEAEKITSEVWYSGVEKMDKDGIVLRFNVFCDAYRSSTVMRALNGELIKMCQRNHIRIARQQSYMMEDDPVKEEMTSEQKKEETRR